MSRCVWGRRGGRNCWSRGLCRGLRPSRYGWCFCRSGRRGRLRTGRGRCIRCDWLGRLGHIHVHGLFLPDALAAVAFALVVRVVELICSLHALVLNSLARSHVWVFVVVIVVVQRHVMGQARLHMSLD